MAIYKNLAQVKRDDLLKHVRGYLINMDLDPAALVIQEFDAMMLFLFERPSKSAEALVKAQLKRILDEAPNVGNPLPDPKPKRKRLTQYECAALNVYLVMLEKSDALTKRDTRKHMMKKAFEQVDDLIVISDQLDQDEE